jgi:SAM-dependent methyltransferase
LRRLYDQRDQARSERDTAIAELENTNARSRDRANQVQDELDQSRLELENAKARNTAKDRFLDRQGQVLQYRRLYFQAFGHIAPNDALPSAHAWPELDDGLSYRDKMIHGLPLSGRGVEIGPLNIPLLPKAESNVLYLDHLDTAGIRTKYPFLDDIVEIDRPMVDGSIEATLRQDAPLDYLIASQVFEHVPNPIRWLNEIAAVLRPGSVFSISLPDRRMTFDLYREETRPSDMIAAYLADAAVPDRRAVYDHHSLACTVNMHWAVPDALFPGEVLTGRGAVQARILTSNPIGLSKMAGDGVYLDVHCWVFTPTTFVQHGADRK